MNKRSQGSRFPEDPDLGDDGAWGEDEEMTYQAAVAAVDRLSACPDVRIRELASVLRWLIEDVRTTREA